jgi:DNA-binding NarL/FixJ family response regulator
MKSNPDTRILVADNHWLIRQGLRATLQRLPGCEVVGEAASVKETVVAAVDLKPHVVVVDRLLPPDGGLEALKQIKERCHDVAVLMLGDDSAIGSVREALRAGCGAYVHKNSGNVMLLREAINAIRGGQIYLDAELTRQLVLSDHRREVAADDSPLSRLTERERAVFKLIGDGYTNRGAADLIHLSHKTVEKHRAAVMQKLQLGSAFELRMLARSLSRAEAKSPEK